MRKSYCFLPNMLVTSIVGMCLALLSDSSVAQGESSVVASTRGHIDITELVFDHLSDADGLSQSTVYCITQDAYGFMWFGTEDGLNRYDGSSFKVFRHNPSDSTSISDNAVLQLLQDPTRTNIIWLVTGSGSLNEFDLNTEKFTRYVLPEKFATSDFAFPANVIAHSRVIPATLWIGAPHALWSFDLKRRLFERVAVIPDSGKEITAVAVRDSLLWLGDNGGAIWELDPRSKKIFQKIQVFDFSDLRDRTVRLVATSRWGVWAGSATSAKKVALKNLASASPLISQYYQGAFCATKDSSSHQAYWFGGQTGVFRVYDNSPEIRSRQVQSFIPRAHVISSYTNRHGDIWFGTRGEGIFKHSPHKRNFNHFVRTEFFPNSIGNTSVRGMSMDSRGILWICGYAGLDALNLKTREVQHFGQDVLGKIPIAFYTVCFSEDENLLYLGAEHDEGLFVFDRRSSRQYSLKNNSGKPLVPHHIYSMVKSKSGNYWLATFGGLFSVNLRNRTAHNWSRDSEVPDCQALLQPISVAEDAKGNVWVGTQANGIIRLDPASKRLRRFSRDSRDTTSIGHSMIRCLRFDHKGRLWIGTGGGGLCLFLGDSLGFKRFTMRDGLPNDVVYGILEDDKGELWLSTNKGISNFRPATFTFRNFDVEDGLQGNEFNSASFYKSSDGQMFLGGLNGVTAFKPNAFLDNPNKPAVVLTNVRLANRKYVPDSSFANTRTIDLYPDDLVATFEFAALEYTTPSKNRFSYRLSALNKEWIDLGTRSEVTLTHLESGTYKLHVRASNNDGVWNNEGLALTIVVHPRYYQTAWFKILMVMLAGAAFTAGVSYRLRDIRRRNRLLTAEVLQRKNAEQRFRDLWEFSPDALLICTSDGSIQLVNARIEQIFSYSHEEIVGLPVTTILPDIILDSVTNTTHLGVNSPERSDERDVKAIRKDGSIFPAGVAINQRETNEGRIYTIAVRDMSERQEMMEQMKMARERLRALSAHIREITEEERQEIARDVHDEFGSAITSLRLGMAVVERTVKEVELEKLQPDAILSEIKAAKNIVDSMMQSARKLIRRLRPEVLDALGILAGLQWLANDWHQRTGTACSFRANVAELSLNERTSTTIFRVVQEALTNVARHANATSVVIELQESDAGLVVEITDNGCGISQSQLNNVNTFGILGMRERLGQMSGTLEISSTPGYGTTVRLWVPKKG